MDKKELTKEKKQTLILITLLVVVVVGLVKTYVLDMMGGQMKEARKTIATLEKQVRDAELQTKNAERNKALLRDITKDLIELNDEGVPLAGNEFAWAARQVYNAGGKLGRSDLEVREHGRTSSDARFVSKLANGAHFQAYAVRVTFSAGYYEIGELLNLITQGNPFVTVSRLTIQASANPERHTVDLLLQWPAWEKPDDFKKQRELAEL